MKNKIFNFVLDLFKNGDKEEQAGILRKSRSIVLQVPGSLNLLWESWFLPCGCSPSETSFMPRLMICLIFFCWLEWVLLSLSLVCITAIIQRPMTFLLSRLSMPDRYITCPCWVAMQLYGQPSSGYGLVVWILSEVSLYLWVE